MVEVIHNQVIAEGHLTVFDNREYIITEGGDSSDPEAEAEYFSSGSGPYHIQLLVDRLVSYYELRNGLVHDRSTVGIRALATQVTPREAVRGMSQEDQLGVPPTLRSGTSRFRSDERLRRDSSRDQEQLRRDRSAAGRVLAIRMARLHAYLQDLISRKAHLPRYQPHVMGDSTTTPGVILPRPTELQLAILGGLVIEGSRAQPPYVADLIRGTGTSGIVNLLDNELPGFGIQYNIMLERERRRITHGYLTDFVLAVIDILDVLIGLAVAVATNTVRRGLTRGLAVIRRESLSEGIETSTRNVARRGSQSQAGRQGDETALPQASRVPESSSRQRVQSASPQAGDTSTRQSTPQSTRVRPRQRAGAYTYQPSTKNISPNGPQNYNHPQAQHAVRTHQLELSERAAEEGLTVATVKAELSNGTVERVAGPNLRSTWRAEQEDMLRRLRYERLSPAEITEVPVRPRVRSTPDDHAEVLLVDYVIDNAFVDRIAVTRFSIAASRPICRGCQRLIRRLVRRHADELGVPVPQIDFVSPLGMR